MSNVRFIGHILTYSEKSLLRFNNKDISYISVEVCTSASAYGISV